MTYKTITDIAAELGCSENDVNNAINRNPFIVFKDIDGVRMYQTEDLKDNIIHSNAAAAPKPIEYDDNNVRIVDIPVPNVHANRNDDWCTVARLSRRLHMDMQAVANVIKDNKNFLRQRGAVRIPGDGGHPLFKYSQVKKLIRNNANNVRISLDDKNKQPSKTVKLSDMQALLNNVNSIIREIDIVLMED